MSYLSSARHLKGKKRKETIHRNRHGSVHSRKCILKKIQRMCCATDFAAKQTILITSENRPIVLPIIILHRQSLVLTMLKNVAFYEIFFIGAHDENLDRKMTISREGGAVGRNPSRVYTYLGSHIE